MFCKKCGNEYRDDYDYCINCGEPNPLKQQQTEPVQAQTPAEEIIDKPDLERNMSMWSVIAFVVAVCGPIIIDLIFANIAKTRIATYKESYGELRDALLTNERLVKAARIIGIIKIIDVAAAIIILFVYLFIYIFLILIGAMVGMEGIY